MRPGPWEGKPLVFNHLRGAHRGRHQTTADAYRASIPVHEDLQHHGISNGRHRPLCPRRSSPFLVPGMTRPAPTSLRSQHPPSGSGSPPPRTEIRLGVIRASWSVRETGQVAAELTMRIGPFRMRSWLVSNADQTHQGGECPSTRHPSQPDLKRADELFRRENGVRPLELPGAWCGR